MKSNLHQVVSTFLVYIVLYFHETVHEKRWLDKSVGQSENVLEHGFVKHSLNSV